MSDEAEILSRLQPGCICKGVKRYRIEAAIAAGAKNFAEVARMTGIGKGSCKARRCGRLVAELLALQTQGSDKE